MSSSVSPIILGRHRAGSSITYNSLAVETMATAGVEELIYRWKINIFPHEYMPNMIESPIFESRNIHSSRSKLSCKLMLTSEKCLQGDFSNTFYIVKLILVPVSGQIENANVTSYVRFKEPFEKSQMELDKEMAEVSFAVVSERNPTINISKILATELFDQKKGYVVDNVLTVHCRILVRGKLKPTSYSISSSKYTLASKNETVAQTMKKVLATSEFSDVLLVTRTKAFPAHKAILAARSPVFAALFRSNMLESTSSRVEIHDFEESAVRALLEFMYTGAISNFAQNAMDLLRISDKYDLSELKTECEEFLCHNLNIENAVEVFILARLVDAATLKASACKFITMNKIEVGETESFKELVQPNPSILLELFMSH